MLLAEASCCDVDFGLSYISFTEEELSVEVAWIHRVGVNKNEFLECQS